MNAIIDCLVIKFYQFLVYSCEVEAYTARKAGNFRLAGDMVMKKMYYQRQLDIYGIQR